MIMRKATVLLLLRSERRSERRIYYTSAAFPDLIRAAPLFFLRGKTPHDSRLQELLGISASELRLNTSVTRIVGSAQDGYSLFRGGGGAGAEDNLGTFDAVVIAAPIGLAGIALDMRGDVRRMQHFFSVFCSFGRQRSASTYFVALDVSARNSVAAPRAHVVKLRHEYDQLIPPPRKASAVHPGCWGNYHVCSVARDTTPS